MILVEGQLLHLAFGSHPLLLAQFSPVLFQFSNQLQPTNKAVQEMLQGLLNLLLCENQEAVLKRLRFWPQESKMPTGAARPGRPIRPIQLDWRCCVAAI